MANKITDLSNDLNKFKKCEKLNENKNFFDVNEASEIPSFIDEAIY